MGSFKATHRANSSGTGFTQNNDYKLPDISNTSLIFI